MSVLQTHLSLFFPAGKSLAKVELPEAQDGDDWNNYCCSFCDCDRRTYHPSMALLRRQLYLASRYLHICPDTLLHGIICTAVHFRMPFDKEKIRNLGRVFKVSLCFRYDYVSVTRDS